MRLGVRHCGQGDARALAAGERRAGHVLLLVGHSARREVRAQRLLMVERAVARELIHQKLARGSTGKIDRQIDVDNLRWIER